MPIERTIYHCKICKRIFFKKGNCIRHEKDCWFDVKNKACVTCFLYRGTEWCKKLEEKQADNRNRPAMTMFEMMKDRKNRMITNCPSWVPITIKVKKKKTWKGAGYKEQRVTFSVESLEKKNANKNS